MVRCATLEVEQGDVGARAHLALRGDSIAHVHYQGPSVSTYVSDPAHHPGSPPQRNGCLHRAGFEPNALFGSN